jgi:hypothetical protein
VKESSEKARLVRLPLPAKLVRKVDELILRGVGGYDTRFEFMQEAIENAVLEYTFPDDSSVGTPRRGPKRSRPAVTDSISESAVEDSPSKLRFEAPEFLLTVNEATVDDAPMLGLHNRDYPTIWAAVQLASITRSEPVGIEKAFQEVTERAWRFGEHLLRLEERHGQRYTALFPTNLDKRSSSEANFRSFAMGRYFRTDTAIKAIGPLFQWRLCGLKNLGREIGIALLPSAIPLLSALDGISASTPHSEQHAFAFLTFLADASPADSSTLMFTLDCVSQRPTRQEVIARLRKAGIGVTAEQGSGYAAGYIARAREWGLVEPKLVDGRYALSALGQTVRKHFSNQKRGRVG